MLQTASTMPKYEGVGCWRRPSSDAEITPNAGARSRKPPDVRRTRKDVEMQRHLQQHPNTVRESESHNAFEKQDRDSGSKDRQGGHEQDRNEKIAQATRSQLEEVHRISTQLQYCQKVVASASYAAPRRCRTGLQAKQHGKN